MKKLIYYCFIVSCFFLAACSKPDLTGVLNLSGILNTNTYYVSFYNTNLDIIRLPVNRYFIYKDSASAVMDSVVVTQSKVETNYSAPTSGYPGNPAIYYDSYTLTLTRFLTSTNSQTWFKGSAVSALDIFPPTAYYTDSSFTLSDASTSIGAFWIPYNSSGNYLYSNFPTLTIEGTTYTDVHSFAASNGMLPTHVDYKSSVFYWVKGIGIIKKEIKTNNSVKTSLLVRFG